MDYILKVTGTQSQTVAKIERAEDGSQIRVTVRITRIIVQDDNGNVFSFSTTYENGKNFVLDQAVTVEVK